MNHSKSFVILTASLAFTIGWAAVASAASSNEAAWDRANAEARFALEKRDAAAALQSAEEAVRIAEKAFGPTHMKTAVSLRSLAQMQNLNGQHEAASVTLRRAAKMWDTNLGAKHPYSSQMLISSAAERAAAKDWEGAKTDLTEALRMQRAYYGNRHTIVATTLQRLARVQRQAGELEAERRSEAEAAGILLEALGAGQPRTLAAFQEMAAHAAERGDTATAREDLKRILIPASEVKNPPLAALSAVWELNGDLAFQDRDPVVAEESYVKGLDLLEPLSASADPSRLGILYKMRELYQANGREQDAAKTSERARAIEATLMGGLASAARPDVTRTQ